MTALADILDIGQLRALIDERYIRMASHPTIERRKILCYTEKTQFAGEWNRETRACRGLGIVLGEHGFEDATIASRGIPKFFTLAMAQANGDTVGIELMDDDEGVFVKEGVSVDGRARVHCADKIDGAMCVGWMSNGDMWFHTKGSFSSDEANIANEVIRQRYDQRKAASIQEECHPGLSPIFEVVTPRFPHVIDYGDLEDLVLLGHVDIRTGLWMPVREDDPLLALGFPTPETIHDGTLSELLELPDRANREGVVVTFTDLSGASPIKVKYDDFLTLQKLCAGVRGRIREITTGILVARAQGKEIETVADVLSLPAKQLSKMLGLTNVSDACAIQHAAASSISSALSFADEVQDELEDVLHEIMKVWRAADDLMHDGKDANAAYVKVTLSGSCPDHMRGEVFAAKRTFLAYASDGRWDEHVDEAIADAANRVVQRNKNRVVAAEEEIAR